jgi:hypothetical protein
MVNSARRQSARSRSALSAPHLLQVASNRNGSRDRTYESFFKLRKSPFGMNPDPNCRFVTPSHREAFAGLLYAISRRKGIRRPDRRYGYRKDEPVAGLDSLGTDAAKLSVILTCRLNKKNA